MSARRPEGGVPDAVLRLEAVTKRYLRAGAPVEALRGIHLEVAPGEFVAIQGPSGSGKTTLLFVAGGLLRPDRGEVTVLGRRIYSLRPEERARLRAEMVGFVFQDFLLIPYLNVLENVLARTLPFRVPDARARAEHLLDRFGLARRAHHYPGQLSAGEMQRAALARALLSRPRLLLADEPTGNLDAENAAEVLAALEEFAREGGSVLLVTHDAELAARADRVLRLREGELTT